MGSKQFGFGDYEQSTTKKRTRRERFMAEMEAVVPWSALIDLIEPSYPRADSKSQHGFGLGWRCAIARSVVMSCITVCMPARID